MRAVVTSWRANPTDWEEAWALVAEKYHTDPADRRSFDTPGPEALTIDATINGAVMGLLHGDPERTMEIAMRGGQDVDCNPRERRRGPHDELDWTGRGIRRPRSGAASATRNGR